MLGPRLGRYSNGIHPLPLGSPVNACMVSKADKRFTLIKFNSFVIYDFRGCLFFGGVSHLIALNQIKRRIVKQCNNLFHSQDGWLSTRVPLTGEKAFKIISDNTNY